MACGICSPCYRQLRLHGEYDPDQCYLANLISPPISESTSSSDYHEPFFRKVNIKVNRLSLKCEKEAQFDNRFGRAVFSSELKIRCNDCYKTGWRPVSGESFGSTVFYYNVEETDSFSQSASEVNYELRFKAQTYSPGCRICGKKEEIEADFHDRVTAQLVNSFVRRVLKVIKMREGWNEDSLLIPELINYQ